MRKVIPAGPSLIVLIGPSGAGKSHWAGMNFPDGEIVSTDAMRIEATGDLRRQDLNDAIFEEFHRRIAVKIQRFGQRVIADATNIRNRDRREVAEIGKMLNVPVTYVVINRSMESKYQTGGWRKDVRKKGRPLMEAMEETFQANEATILAGDHGLADLVVDTRTEEFEVAMLLPPDRTSVFPHLLNRGFEFVRVLGDVHGNMAGLRRALEGVDDRGVTYILSLGDVVDYGSDTLNTADVIHHLVRHGQATMVRGNHERKIRNWVRQVRTKDGFRGKLSFGNDVTTNQLLAMNPVDRAAWEARFLALVDMSPDWVQMGNTLFVHGAAHPRMWGNSLFRAPPNSGVESNALFGETTGETDPTTGFPVRKYDWVHELEPGQDVVVGHAIMSTEAPVLMRGRNGGNAMFLDTGSGKEGKLSWMDFEIVETRRGPKLQFRDLWDEHGNLQDFMTVTTA